MSADFTPEQRRYLEGLVAGLAATRGGGAPAPMGPDAAALIAQDATTQAGKKLVDQEVWKREEHPFDAYPRLKAMAAEGQYPKPADNFRWRYYGLFYLAPNQNSYMCRLRIANGILSHWQLRGVADLAERLGGGYVDVTTRANLQIREITAEHAPAMVEGVQDLGLTSRGSGADNIRNVTGTPTAGIDPQELIDTRPYARDWHFHILNDRSLYGLPRKFNVAFDGGGRIAALEETNDIGFQAVEVLEGSGVEPGVWFRLMLGGITGHQDFARDTGVVVKPHDATKVADAVLRVFIERGDRTNRNKARLKYVLDAMGYDAFLAAVEAKLGATFIRVAPELVAPRPPTDRMAHLGAHPQKQAGLNWLGVVLPVGRLTAQQCRIIADVAQKLGDGDIRLTVWQNLLISGIADVNLKAAQAWLEESGLSTKATPIRAGLVACTGNTGCKFAASNTKGTAEAIARFVEANVALDQPINIHLTGCHHSCAQHYIGDIGMIATKIDQGDDAEPIEGFHILVGGGTGPQARLAQEVWLNVPNAECPAHVARLLAVYLTHRAHAEEPFYAFATRLDVSAIKTLCAQT